MGLRTLPRAVDTSLPHLSPRGWEPHAASWPTCERYAVEQQDPPAADAHLSSWSLASRLAWYLCAWSANGQTRGWTLLAQFLSEDPAALDWQEGASPEVQGACWIAGALWRDPATHRRRRLLQQHLDRVFPRDLPAEEALARGEALGWGLRNAVLRCLEADFSREAAQHWREVALAPLLALAAPDRLLNNGATAGAGEWFDQLAERFPAAAEAWAVRGLSAVSAWLQYRREDMFTDGMVSDAKALLRPPLPLSKGPRLPAAAAEALTALLLPAAAAADREGAAPVGATALAALLRCPAVSATSIQGALSQAADPDAVLSALSVPHTRYARADWERALFARRLDHDLAAPALSARRPRM